MEKLRNYLTENKYKDNQWLGIVRNGQVTATTVSNINLIIKDSDPEIISVDNTYIAKLGVIPIFIVYG